MRKLVSTHLFRRQRLGPAQLDLLLEAGLDGVEIFAARSSFDYHDRRQMAELAGWFSSHALPVDTLHSPIYADEKDGRSGEPPVDIAGADHRRRLEAIDEIQRALEFCERVPVRYLVQHLGIRGAEWEEARADRALTSLERIRLLAKQAGVSVLVENITNGLSTPDRLIAFLEQNHLDDIGICFDSGHAHMSADLFGGGGVAASWERLGARVRSTHLHDNHGHRDEHLWPGEAGEEGIAWAEFAPKLKAADVPWVLEVGAAGNGDVRECIRNTFASLEARS